MSNIDSTYWDDLARLNPETVCIRTMADYQVKQRGYTLPILNQDYLVLPYQQQIKRVIEGGIPPGEDLTGEFTLMVLFYLLKAKNIPLARKWISEKDLPSGETFFRGPHALSVDLIEKKYGDNPEGFIEAGKVLGGTPVRFGDKSIALDVFPRIPIIYIVWMGDEEFPTKAGVLFDASIGSHFTLDIIWIMVNEVSRRLVQAGR
ncbi:MAG: DUF3786 domain-containing protein [Syntrophobacterales bacterium]|nr:MAG: DUF3786 domain-containing protein [Syntrophobacterales bacterium]